MESPREFRLHPRDRFVAYTADAAGARQLFVLPLRGGYPLQLTASEKNVSDPQWSPDGRRLAYVRDNEIRVIEADGSRDVGVTAHPAGVSAPRWSPDGRRLAFISRRRGWSQVWVVDAPVPRRGRPARDPRPPEPRHLSATGIDVEDLSWSAGRPNDRRQRPAGAGPLGRRDPPRRRRNRATNGGSPAAARSGRAAPRPMPDGGWLYGSDAERLVPDRPAVRRRPRAPRPHDRRARARRAVRGPGYAALPSPDGSRFVHIDVPRRARRSRRRADPATGRRPKRGRGRPPKNPPAVVAAAEGRVVNPWPGVWRAVGWLVRRRMDRGRRRERDRAAGPVAAAGPGVAPRAPDRARSRTRCRRSSRPRFAAGPRRPPSGSRSTPATASRSRARSGARPDATGRRGSKKVPVVLYPHGGPTWQAYRGFAPFKQLLVREGFAVLDVDFRGSTGLRPRVPPRQPRRVGPRRPPRHDRRRPLGGGAAVVRRAAGDLRRLVRRLPRPVARSSRSRASGGRGSTCTATPRSPRAIRHGDRPGRLDLGTPDGLAGRPGAAELLPARLAGLPGRADRGAAADPPRPQGQAGRPAHDRADGRGPRDRGQASRGPLVRRRGPRLGEAREPARRLRPNPRAS